MESLRVLFLVALYDVIALLLLRQWHGNSLWTALDPFSATYLAMCSLLAVQQAVFSTQFSPEVKTVLFAKEIDPRWDLWVCLLGISELGVLFDYAHVHSAPWMVHPWLQYCGVAVALIAVAWLWRVDSYLSRTFAAKLEAHQLMMEGPYRQVRHPRYAGLALTRLALPLLMPGWIALAIFCAWLILIHRRVGLEERYLARLYGPAYSQYATRTPGLLPVGSLWRSVRT